MKLRRRCIQTLGVSVKQLRRKFVELGTRILHIHHQTSKSCDMALMMLSVSTGMDVGCGGIIGGNGGGNGSLEISVSTNNPHQKAIRTVSIVRQDLALDLPPRLQLPDGEEKPYGALAGLHLRDPEQESEIYQKCVRPPPNRTIFDSESPPSYKNQSTILDTNHDRLIRCHSTGSSFLRVFRKLPNNISNSIPVVVPRPSLSSYSESNDNLNNNLSSLTVVSCEADENYGHHYHHHHHNV